jgi:hypothetical protein
VPEQQRRREDVTRRQRHLVELRRALGISRGRHRLAAQPHVLEHRDTRGVLVGVGAVRIPRRLQLQALSAVARQVQVGRIGSDDPQDLRQREGSG